MPSHFVSDIEIHVLCLICGVVCSEIDFVFHGLKSGIVGHLDRSLDSSDVRRRIGSSNYLAVGVCIWVDGMKDFFEKV